MTKVIDAPSLADIPDSGDIYDDPAPDDEEERPELAAVPDDDTEEIPETEPAEDEEEERLYAGKYKTVEEMERAYEDLQSEKGRLANEVGEKRDLEKRLAALEGRLEQDEDYADESPSWWEQLEPEEINAAIAQNPGMVLDAIVKDQVQRLVGPQLSQINDVLTQNTAQATRSAEVDRAYAQVADYWARHPELKELEPDVGEYFAENAELFSDAMFSGEQTKIDKAMNIMTTLVLDRSGVTSPRAPAKAKARTAPARGNRNPKASKDPVTRTIEMIRGAAAADQDLFT